MLIPLAIDTCYVSSDRRRRRAASLISPQPRRVHRLGRRHAVAYNCHCAIVFLSSSTTAQCATMFATTSPANTRQSSNRQQSRLLLRSTGRCLQSPPESTSVRPRRRCPSSPTRLLGEAIRTHHDAAPRSSLVAGAGAYTVSSLCVLTYRCLNGTAPSYLAESICRVADVEGRRHLRSSATTALIVPPVRRSTLGDRSFPVAAPRAWNSLPPVVRSSSTLITFRRELKTFLYHSSFVNQ